MEIAGGLFGGWKLCSSSYRMENDELRGTSGPFVSLEESIKSSQTLLEGIGRDNYNLLMLLNPLLRHIIKKVLSELRESQIQRRPCFLNASSRPLLIVLLF